jgi:hypothetical protein
MPLYRQEVHDAIHGLEKDPTFSKLALMGGMEEQTSQPKKNGESTNVTLSPGQIKFLNKLAQSLKKNTGTDFNASAVAQALIDAVEKMEVDLSKATSLEDFKKLLIEGRKGSEN